LERLELHRDAVAEIGQVAGLNVDVRVSRQIAAWGYTSAKESGGSAWLAAARYETIDESYSGCFATNKAWLDMPDLGATSPINCSKATIRISLSKNCSRIRR
jgi:hypothetical protein